MDDVTGNEYIVIFDIFHFFSSILNGTGNVYIINRRSLMMIYFVANVTAHITRTGL